jgi:hypothetical protein
VVETDESKSGKRKYNRGHRVKVQWAFGGVAREIGRTFLVAVQDRIAESLMAASSREHSSDCWVMYRVLEGEGYSLDSKSFDTVHESRNRS